MTEESYTTDDDQQPPKRLTAAALARALGLSLDAARAIVSGEVPNCSVTTFWVTGGQITLTDASLADWRQSTSNVARFGIDAVRDAEHAEMMRGRP